MDASRLDRLVQVVGGGSRRTALRTALGGATVAAAGLLASTGIGAKKKKRKKKCKKKTCQGKAQGEACTTNKECCANETQLACARASGVNQPVCCGTLGAPCGVDGKCCLGFECFSGQCLFPV